MICNDLVMPMLLRFAWLRPGGTPRSFRPAARHPARRHLLHPADRLPLLPADRRILRAGLDRPGVVRRGSTVRPGAARRHVLEGRVAARRARRHLRRLRCCGPTRCCCRRSLAPAGCRTASSKLGRSASRCCSPTRCSGCDGFGPTAHALFWSLLANVGAFVAVSLLDRQSTIERIQATLFVEVFEHAGPGAAATLLHRTVSVPELRTLAERFLGRERTRGGVRRVRRPARHRSDRSERWPTASSCSSSSGDWQAPSARPRRG